MQRHVPFDARLARAYDGPWMVKDRPGQRGHGDQKKGTEMSVLSRVDGPEDIRALTPAERVELAEDVRALMMEVVQKNGGPLSPNLGLVELSIALLVPFDTPRDAAIWAVGP